MASLIERARKLRQEDVHLGGPERLFEIGGRRQLMILLNEGLLPDSKVLDIGCGSLRGGYWMIHFLNPGCYFGIEPDRRVYEAGLKILLEPEVVELKRPRIDSNGELDFSVFGERFNFFVARSVWTHAPKSAVVKMLDGFVRHSEEGAIFLTSYLRASRLKRDDYQGERWVFIGNCLPHMPGGMTRHSFNWIKTACRERGLSVEEIEDKTFDFGHQTWLKIRAGGA